MRPWFIIGIKSRGVNFSSHLFYFSELTQKGCVQYFSEVVLPLVGCDLQLWTMMQSDQIINKQEPWMNDAITVMLPMCSYVDRRTAEVFFVNVVSKGSHQLHQCVEWKAFCSILLHIQLAIKVFHFCCNETGLFSTALRSFDSRRKTLMYATVYCCAVVSFE